MEPKEKAKELYNKMKFEAECNSQPSTVNGMCKKLASVCVDEILQTNPTLKGTSDDLITMIVQTKAYWYRVQEEINML